MYALSGLGDLLLGLGLSIVAPNDGLPGPDVVGADRFPMPPAVADLEILSDATGV